MDDKQSELNKAYKKGCEYGGENWHYDLDILLEEAYDHACEFLNAVEVELNGEQQDMVIGAFLGGVVGEAHRQRVARIRQGLPLND